MAFNAELGSPLIKVKASERLTWAEREREKEKKDGERRVRQGDGREREKKKAYLLLRLINRGIQIKSEIILQIWLGAEPLFSQLLLL